MISDRAWGNAGGSLEATGAADPVVTLPDVGMNVGSSNSASLLDIDLDQFPDFDLDQDFLREFATPDAVLDASWPSQAKASSFQKT